MMRSMTRWTLAGFMTLGAVGSMVGATLIGPMKDHFDWDVTFFAFVGMMAVSWLIMHFINIDQHVAQLTELDNEEAESQELLVH